ncbi:RHS repeat-associated core domain-containing protein [Fangia hongkongensis]|uniref:RHS repeat-associated core domain-containing protein n=1 Tax=Fangia hongkongensis TaxID=270495 RepID=UPI00146A82BB|nr:RHS repeat-associated core domain-containing protein [Fangia hongkongensis]
MFISLGVLTQVYAKNISTQSDTQLLSLSSDTYQFAGEYQDSEDNAIYLRARYYNPQQNRFVSQDTYGLFNRYAYVGGQVINDIDPTGHHAKNLWHRMWHSQKYWRKTGYRTSIMVTGALLSIAAPLILSPGLAPFAYIGGGVLNLAAITQNMIEQGVSGNKNELVGNILALTGMVVTSVTWTFDDSVIAPRVRDKLMTATERMGFNFVGNFVDNTLANLGINYQSGNMHGGQFLQSMGYGAISAAFLAGTSAIYMNYGVFDEEYVSRGTAAVLGGVRGGIAQGLNTYFSRAGMTDRWGVRKNINDGLLISADMGFLSGALLFAGTHGIYNDEEIKDRAWPKLGAQTSLSTIWQTDMGPINKQIDKAVRS